MSAALADAKVEAAREFRVGEVAVLLGIEGLKRAGQEMVGPCPACGGRDRFGINDRDNVFNCRHCGGGDAIALVQLVKGCDFKAAVGWLVGEAEVRLDPEEERRRAAARETDRRERERREARERDQAIRQAREIWKVGRPGGGGLLTEYLRRRGLPGRIAVAPPLALRLHPDLAYVVREGDVTVAVHRGPAMLAAIQGPDGRFIGVHRTWLDLAQPKGKVVIHHKGEVLPAKKIWGSKKGGAIRLTHPRDFDFRTLVMGEGIETTATAMAADLFPGAAYWAGVDLGNMAGRRVLRGEGMKYRGIPDLEDREAFLPPQGTRRLIFIQDGDSDPRLTRAKLLAGLRRAKALVPGLETIEIAHAGEGVDLNDVLMEAGAAGPREG